MATEATIPIIAGTREILAVDLEHAIAALGRAYRAFNQETATLAVKAGGVDLSSGIDAIVVRHLAKAGLTALLERKFVGTPSALLEAVERQHRELLGLEPTHSQY